MTRAFTWLANVVSFADAEQCDTLGQDGPGEAAFTTFHGGCRGTVDYIWYGSGLSVIGRMEMQSYDRLARYGGLPTKVWSSDHMSLVVDFVFDADLETPATSTREAVATNNGPSRNA